MPGSAYPYNVFGIYVPGYTASSTIAEGDTLFRYQVTRGRPPHSATIANSIQKSNI